ncbi:terpenoid synthase [Leucogyrophana mollusca]|uniref:Terpenoid synthase n=1 Tax=Leucogyrophana mollusca TaxID=85980 RepID=A0ACB8B442_9AGAM|nr:terpenoid synthase [Leucogyrophana mollusca]
MTTTNIYQLPDLLARFPEKSGGVNPHLAEVNDEHIKWLNDCPAFGPSDREALHKAWLPLLAASFFPKVDANALRAITDYVTATVILDKTNDTATEEKAEEFSLLYTSAFNNPSEGIKHKPPFFQLISSLALALGGYIEPAYRMDFLSANGIFAWSTAQEAIERRAAQDTNAKMTMEAYFTTRRDSVSIRPYIVLIRSTRSLSIPKDVLHEPSVRGMEEATIDLIIIANDIYSYKKELAEDNAPHNLLTVLLNDPPTPHLDLQGAIDYAGKLFELALDRFRGCRVALPSINEETDRMLVEYADGLSDLFVGGIEWGLVVPRYQVFDTEEHRQNRWMVL